MVCKSGSPLAMAVRAYRDFHFRTGLLLDKGARLLGVNRFPLTKPLYKVAKIAGYTNVALASIALVLLED
ncbi:MAG: hypothetical protein RMK91_05955 [Pseudanabaenaceae cyanobacterium SKYGB_i_bin29]|nr:hypothetical protein [Pseudanabaenaceae cyanobacterium SKYG29]MDW8421395.1 hypothetical protein [Pseudanabaenaceae cyanobacterium SKYGB_i_bin29]